MNLIKELTGKLGEHDVLYNKSFERFIYLSPHFFLSVICHSFYKNRKTGYLGVYKNYKMQWNCY